MQKIARDGGEVVGVVGAAVCAVTNVVGLEAVAAVAAVDGASPVMEGNEAAYRRRYRSRGLGGGGFAVVESDQVDPAAAQDLFEYGGADTGAVLEFGAGFPTGLCGKVAVNEDRCHWF